MSKSKSLFPAAVVCTAALAAPVVRDINTQPVPHAGYVSPQSATLTAGNLFVADDNLHGTELWISDGTAPGTHLVRDIHAGSAGSEIYGFQVMGGVAYFFADDGINGSELWRSDGTYAGTRIVANIGPGSGGSGGGNGVYVPANGGVVYFTADDGVHGQELWRSDGTAAGTWIVVDIAAGAGSPEIDSIVVAGNRLFFTAVDSAGREPWISDGTAAGTHRAGDLNPGVDSSIPVEPVALGGTVFFAASDPAHGRELWRLKAGEQLAALVTDLNIDLAALQPPAGQTPFTKGSDPASLTVSGDSVLFTAVTTLGNARTNKLYRVTADANSFVTLNDLGPDDRILQILPVGAHGAVFSVTYAGGTEAVNAIFVTDGTTAGSQSLASRNLWFTNTTSARARSADGNEVYFFARAQNASDDVDLWRSDGTAANTRIYAELNDNVGSWEINRIGSRLFFTNGHHGDGHNKEMWVSDGTSAGTYMIRDLNPGEDSSQPYSPQVIGNRLMFAAFTPLDPATFWITDGTNAGTLPLAKIPVDFENQSSRVNSFGASTTNIFYTADDGINGTALWASDGTTANTRLVKDLSPGNESVSSLPMMSLGAVQIFNNRDVIWRTDGTAAGTYALADTSPGTIGDVWWPIYRDAPSVVGTTAYFFVNSGGNVALWRTNGSVAGTTLVADLTSVTQRALGLSGALGSRIFFTGAVGQNGNALYSTDGTPAGTVLISATHAINDGGKILNGRMCFNGNDGVPHPVSGGYYYVTDIWCSNGTAGDLVRITDGNDHDRHAGEFFVAGNLMFVNSYSQDATDGLWIANGTAGASRQLISEHASDVVRFGANYLIATYDNPAGPRLLLSDGTIAGTRDFLQGATVEGVLTGQFQVFGSYVIFPVKGPEGVVIWRSDGTPAGTRFVTDVNPSTADDQYPLDFRVIGTKLLFTTAHPVIGEELWMLSATDPVAAEDSLRAAYQTATSANVLVNDGDIDGTLDITSVQVVDAPASGTASVNPATGAIGYTPNTDFTGYDSLTYRVRDNQGNWSNAAKLSVIVDQPVGGNPANAPANITPAPMPAPPAPPVSNPPPTTPVTPAPSGGGGGALGFEAVLLALLLLARGARRRWVH